MLFVPLLPGRWRARHDCDLPPGGAAVLRQADHAVGKLRRPGRDRDRECAGCLGELRARTDELAQRQAELRVTFENMGDGVAMFDETPRLVAWNRKFQEILDVPDGLPRRAADLCRIHPLSHRAGRVRRGGRPGGPASPPDRECRGTLFVRAHAAGRPGDRGPPQPGAERRLRADLRRHHRAQAERGGDPRRPRCGGSSEPNDRCGLSRAEGRPGQSDPGREDGLAGPAHRRDRARDQEPAQLRQQLRHPVGRAAGRTERDCRAGAGSSGR